MMAEMFLLGRPLQIIICYVNLRHDKPSRRRRYDLGPTNVKQQSKKGERRFLFTGEKADKKLSHSRIIWYVKQNCKQNVAQYQQMHNTDLLDNLGGMHWWLGLGHPTWIPYTVGGCPSMVHLPPGQSSPATWPVSTCHLPNLNYPLAGLIRHLASPHLPHAISSPATCQFLTCQPCSLYLQPGWSSTEIGAVKTTNCLFLTFHMPDPQASQTSYALWPVLICHLVGGLHHHMPGPQLPADLYSSV